MYDAYIYDPRSLTLMHVSIMHKCTMHMSMILVPDVCVMHKFTMQISPILVSDVCSMHKCMMHIS